MIKRPEEIPAAFAAAFNARDVDALLKLYHDDAVMSPDGVNFVSGPQIRDALNQFLALNGPIEMKLERAATKGDTALVVAAWTLSGQTPDGPLTLTGRTADVLRKGEDGGWRYEIDAPMGLRA